MRCYQVLGAYSLLIVFYGAMSDEWTAASLGALGLVISALWGLWGLAPDLIRAFRRGLRGSR